MHVALIPDGNRRYSRENNLTLKQGYEHGKEKALEIINLLLSKKEIQYITLWVLSKANLSRQQSELEPVLDVFLDFLRSWTRSVWDLSTTATANLKIIGDTSRLPDKILTEFSKFQPHDPQKKTLILAVGYCGQDDIRRAVAAHGTNWEKHLDTANIPNPDAVIRTGREIRLSNFMNFQTGNSALYFLDKYWPELTKKDILRILKDIPRQKLNRQPGL